MTHLRSSRSRATVLIHGRDAQTRLKIAGDASQRPVASLGEQIMAALLEAIFLRRASASAPHLAESPVSAGV
jgi:hypothetical protein